MTRDLDCISYGHALADGGHVGRKSYSAVAKSAASADVGETSQPASLTPVIWAVAIASFGAFAFGYHCGVVNGPLNAIAADLGFAGNAALQGTVSALLACKSGTSARLLSSH